MRNLKSLAFKRRDKPEWLTDSYVTKFLSRSAEITESLMYGVMPEFRALRARLTQVFPRHLRMSNRLMCECVFYGMRGRYSKGKIRG